MINIYNNIWKAMYVSFILNPPKFDGIVLNRTTALFMVGHLK